MTIVPSGVTVGEDYFAGLYLVDIDTPDGSYGLIVGADGKFTDLNAKVWYGSTLFSAGDIEEARGGVAPSGSLSMTFFQDPDTPSLIEEIRAQGEDYIKGRECRFYTQVFADPDDLYAPKVAPILRNTRIMRGITFSATGAQDRSITVDFESVNEARNQRRGLVYNTTDHARLIGSANPSLSFIPQDNFRQQKMFG